MYRVLALRTAALRSVVALAHLFKRVKRWRKKKGVYVGGLERKICL